ncbi:hypothetical protein KDL44_12100 [bacterium]|nr:hypothetical protein [bacterium]
MKILRLMAVSVMCSAAVFGACTSSNSPTQNNIQTNSQYDSQYRDQTRSANQQNRTAEEAAEMGDPPITLMVVAMETGDVFPGEDYFIYVVDDNPDGRDLEYEWGVVNGDIWPVAEADRGRLRTIVETEYNTAQPEISAPLNQDPAAGAFGDVVADTGDAVAPPGAQAPGAGGQPVAGGSTTQVPAAGGSSTQQPAAGGNSTQPTQNTNTDTQNSDTTSGNQDLFNNTTGGSSNNSQNTSNNADTTPTEKTTTYDPSRLQENTYGDQGQYKIIIPPGLTNWPDGTPFDPSLITILNKLRNNEPLTADEETDLLGSDKRMRDYADLKAQGDAQSDRSAIDDGYILRRMVIAGQAVIDDEGRRMDNEVAGNVVDKSIENATAMLEEQLGTEYEDVDVVEAPRREYDSRGLRYEYQDWQDEGTEPRRRGLGGYAGEYSDDDPADAEDSFDRYSLITDDPYIEWTPRTPGRVNIWVRAMYHDEYVTEARNLEVEVRLRDPEVEMVKDFPDVVREDESVYVRIDGSNLPDFDKGLFTLSFDNTKLSFREAELGEFFDDYSDASIYFAQPNKDEGKVLIALDSNTVITEPSGDGPLVYVKFKAKEDLETSDETQLSMVMDTSARYILDKDGTNVLPLPLNLPPWRTQLVMPPELPNYERENTPGTQAGTVPTGNRTPPGAQAPGTQTPATSGTGSTTQVPLSGGNAFTQDSGFLSTGGRAGTVPTNNTNTNTGNTNTNTGNNNNTGNNTNTGNNNTDNNNPPVDTSGLGTARQNSDADEDDPKAAAREDGTEDPATAGKSEGTEEPAEDPDAGAEEPASDDPAADEPAKDEPAKDEPQKDEPKKDE